MSTSPLEEPQVDTPMKEFIRKPLAPFEGKSLRKAAATAAMYYGECSLQGITTKEATLAAEESRAHFQNWWLQSRFTKSQSTNNKEIQESTDVISDIGDSVSIRTHKRPIENNFKLNENISGRREKRRRSISSHHTTTATSNAPGGREKRRRSMSSHHTKTATANAPSSFFDASDEARLVSSSEDDTNAEFARATHARRLEHAKTEVLRALSDADGQTTGARFLAAVDELVKFSKKPATVQNQKERCHDGVWLTLSKMNWQECLGKNSDGEFMYTLGRMSFDMFRPSGKPLNTPCSIQGVFNPVFVTETLPDAVPRSLQREIRKQNSTLRTNNIVVAFTVESPEENAPPIKGVMTTYGYILPDPDVPDHHSIWFTGGTLEASDETDKSMWERTFGGYQPKRKLMESARMLAAKIMFGAMLPERMEEDGSLSYYLKRPIGGHGVVYNDVLYVDNTIRIMQGHHGTIYVMKRVETPD